MRSDLHLRTCVAALAFIAAFSAVGLVTEPARAEAESTATEETSASDARFQVGANLRVGFSRFPDFALEPFFDLYQSHWEDGPRVAYGFEIVLRYLNKHDLFFGFEFQNYGTPAGLWLQDGDNVDSANFVENNLRLYSLLIGYEFVGSFLDDGALQVYAGLGAGVSLVGGKLRTYELNPACIDPLDDRDVDALGDIRRGEPCGNDPENDDIVLGYDSDEESIFSTREDVPSVLPSFKVSTGIRYLIDEKYGIGFEGGFFNLSFYFGFELGFILPVRDKERTHAGGLSSADDQTR